MTATKQSDTVNRVPLSITAVTQASIDQQGVKTAQDLARTVPSLNISTSNVANGANIAIRGIYSSIGAPTTAVYLDDVAIQRRTTLGTFSGSGVVFPALFDLQRVEVLRGPQGDLYGGSAEGGAIRFITPDAQPDHLFGHRPRRAVGHQERRHQLRGRPGRRRPDHRRQAGLPAPAPGSGATAAISTTSTNTPATSSA